MERAETSSCTESIEYVRSTEYYTVLYVQWVPRSTVLYISVFSSHYPPMSMYILSMYRVPSILACDIRPNPSQVIWPCVVGVQVVFCSYLHQSSIAFGTWRLTTPLAVLSHPGHAVRVPNVLMSTTSFQFALFALSCFHAVAPLCGENQ